jgi:hypothetical protein
MTLRGETQHGPLGQWYHREHWQLHPFCNSIEHVKSKSVDLGFAQSKHDESVLYTGTIIYIVYTYDSILLGANPVGQAIIRKF